MDPVASKTAEQAEIHDSLSKDNQHVAELEFEKPQVEALPVTSAFATLPRAACIRKFWRLFAAGLCVAISGMYVVPFSL